MILQYVLISWSRKDGTSWYAITTFVLNQEQCSFGVLACMNDKCVCVCVMCAPECSEQCYATGLLINRCFSKQQVCMHV